MAALVVVGGSALRELAAAAVGEVAPAPAATAGVDSKPFACSNDSSVFVDLSAVVLADVLVVHFITGRGLLVTLLELLLLPLLLGAAGAASLLLLPVVPWCKESTAAEAEGCCPAAALTSVAAAEAVAFF